MNPKRQQEAERIYQKVHVTDKMLMFYSEAELRQSRPIAFATIDEIYNFLQTVEDARIAAGLPYLDSDKIPFGASRDEIFAIAESKKKASNRRAGARALVNKYGKAAAEDIIARKTGKRYNLKEG